MCSQQITERITISVGLSQVLGEIIFGMIPNDQHIDVLLVYVFITVFLLMLKSLTSVQTSKSISRQVIAVSMAPLRNRCIANELDEIAPNSTDEGGPSYSDTTAQGRYRSP